MTLTVRDIHRRADQSGFPRSGFLALSSRGRSQAELAANLNGVAYAELGRGPMDYGSLTFLSADMGTRMFRALIPGAETRTPEMRCGVTLGKFTDGIGITPYGYAARTQSANLMGEMEVDLRKERLNIRFQSRSREGVGISISNAFSNTVTIQGPLTEPEIVPNTRGMLVRGWAAFLTAGISMLGESMFNRVLASANPCDEIRNEIRKELCPVDPILATSPLVCPGGGALADGS